MDTPQEISAFFESIFQHLEKKKDQNIQSKEIQKFEVDLATSRLATINLNNNLNQNLKSEESNINVKYVELQDRNNYYLKNINTLEEKLKQIKMGIEQEKAKMAAEAEINLKTQEKLWQRKIEEANNQIKKRKLDHEKKKEKLTNDLTTAQLTNDLELDEIEITLRRELIDLNQKIWRQNAINSDMKKQIEELKNQKKPPTTNISTNFYQDDLLLMNDIEDFFNSTGGNLVKPPQQISTSNALQGPSNKNNFASDKNKARIYNSNYQPLDISKHTPKTYYNNLLAETVEPDNSNQFEFIHNNFDIHASNTANINSKQENLKIKATTMENFESKRNMSNPVQFTTAQTNKLDENRTMQNQSSNQQTLERSPADFYNNFNSPNWEEETLPLEFVEIKSGPKKTNKSEKQNIQSKNKRGPVRSKNKDGNDGLDVMEKKQTNKKGRPIKRIEDEIIKVKDRVLDQETVPKKRKMCDPNNHDYLDEMMANYVTDD